MLREQCSTLLMRRLIVQRPEYASEFHLTHDAYVR